MSARDKLLKRYRKNITKIVELESFGFNQMVVNHITQLRRRNITILADLKNKHQVTQLEIEEVAKAGMEEGREVASQNKAIAKEMEKKIPLGMEAIKNPKKKQFEPEIEELQKKALTTKRELEVLLYEKNPENSPKAFSLRDPSQFTPKEKELRETLTSDLALFAKEMGESAWTEVCQQFMIDSYNKKQKSRGLALAQDLIVV